MTNKIDELFSPYFNWPQNLAGSSKLPGIKNEHLNCFGNCILQVFNHTPIMINLYKHHSQDGDLCSCDDCNSCLMQSYIEMFEENHEENQTIDADYFLYMFMQGSGEFTFGKTGDPSELLMHIISNMPRNDDIVESIFCCENGYVYRCNECKFEWCVETNKHVRLCSGIITDVLADMRQEKLFDGQRTCSKCNELRGCTEKFVIKQSPPVLSIKLPDSDEENIFPEKINMRPYMTNKYGGATVYELYAVIVHKPFKNIGHYFIYCKAPNGQWNVYSDKTVKQVSLLKVLSCKPTSLFYKRSPHLDDSWNYVDDCEQRDQMIELSVDRNRLKLKKEKRNQEEMKREEDNSAQHDSTDSNFWFMILGWVVRCLWYIIKCLWYILLYIIRFFIELASN